MREATFEQRRYIAFFTARQLQRFYDGISTPVFFRELAIKSDYIAFLFFCRRTLSLKIRFFSFQSYIFNITPSIVAWRIMFIEILARTEEPDTKTARKSLKNMNGNQCMRWMVERKTPYKKPPMLEPHEFKDFKEKEHLLPLHYTTVLKISFLNFALINRLTHLMQKLKFGLSI